ncbi:MULTISPECIES: hypothetical protein [unclassified Nocardioides]|uniref:hypothetical protein n=1 Tax=unclassified Nocardioides TaxID=2615069 RepID=UPI000056F894|nr:MULTISPECIES: hypothetical protein [unclassified Nocardioides]ABL83211.1 hypothetical protein Noca_3711 [Nocardioides sp. JS614]
MRRILGTTLLVLALPLGAAACGDDEGVSAIGDPPAPEVTLVSGTAAGGQVADGVTVLDGRAAIRAYAGGFRGPLAGKVASAATGFEVPPDAQLVAAVVAVGCDVPPDVDVVGEGAATTFVPARVPSPRQECFAPVTTVALAAVPQDGGE